MKKSFLIKLTSLILSVVMLFSVVPISAAAVTYESNPIIYIGGMTENIIYRNPDKLNSSEICNVYSDAFIKSAANIGVAFIVASFKDVGAAEPEIKKGIDSIMAPISFNQYGEPTLKNSGVMTYNEPVVKCVGDPIYTENMSALVKAASKEIDENEIFCFSYDWRLSPVDNAVKLRDYIDGVKQRTDKNMVSLLAASNGGVVANAYLHEYMDHARMNVSKCVFLDAPLLGNALIGDFMSGRLAKTLRDDESLIGKIETINGKERGEAFFNYINNDPTGITNRVLKEAIRKISNGINIPEFDDKFMDLAIAIGKIIALGVLQEEDIDKKLGKAYNDFILVADDPVYKDCLAKYLRNIPGLWAIVPEKNFEDAKKFIFEVDDVIPEKRLMAKINEAHDILTDTAETLQKAQLGGIKINIVANYGIPILPATVSMKDNSDGIQSVKYASCGATTADCGKNWPFDERCSKHNHMSPDGDINATTCVFPENTWFIKDLKHNDFKYKSTADFLIWLLTGSRQRNVFMDARYPQFMIFNKYTHLLKAYSDPDDPSAKYTYGDPDEDGIISASDARITLRTSVGLEGFPSKIYRIIMDVDGDENISASDARYILRKSVFLEEKFPVEK